MESITIVKNPLKVNVYMALIDLKDAFISVPEHPELQKYQTFYLKKKYTNLCMPNTYVPVLDMGSEIFS